MDLTPKFRLHEKRDWFLLVLSLYILAIGVEALVTTQVLGVKVYLPELVFPILVVIGILQLPAQGFRIKSIDLLAGGYWLAVFLSFLFNRTHGAMTEVLGASYMLGLYLLIRIGRVRPGELIKTVLAVILVMGFSSALVIGIYLLSGDNTYVQLHKQFYLLGDVIRSSGFARSPLMQAEYLGFALLLLMPALKNNSIFRSIIWIAGLMGLALTVTKSILVFGCCALLLWSRSGQFARPTRRLLRITALGMGVFYLVASHVFIYPAGTEAEATPYTCKEYNLGAVKVIPSPYLHLKSAALRSFPKNPVFGIGGNTFIEKAGTYYELGRMSCPVFLTPHSSYTGILVELGLFGILAFAALISGAISMTRQLPPEVRGVAFVAGIYILLQAVTFDIMNFRHYWIALAVIVNLEPLGTHIQKHKA